MTEITQSNNVNDKLVSLQKEAEGLKVRLEEERQKLNDITCKLLYIHMCMLLSFGIYAKHHCPMLIADFFFFIWFLLQWPLQPNALR